MTFLTFYLQAHLQTVYYEIPNRLVDVYTCTATNTNIICFISDLHLRIWIDPFGKLKLVSESHLQASTCTRLNICK